MLKDASENITNLFEGIPTRLSEEFSQILLQKPPVRIERIVSQGQSSPEGFWYDQEEHEWVLLVKGAARIEFEDGRQINLKPGDCIHIAAHERHRVGWTDPSTHTIWLAVFW